MADLVSPANYNIIKPEGFAAYKQAIDEQNLKQQVAQAQVAHYLASAKLAEQGAKLPAPLQLANEYQKRVAAGDIDGANLIAQFAKTQDKGLAVDASGNYAALPGYAGAVGTIEQGKQTGKNISDLAYKPAIAGGEANAKANVEIATAPTIASGKKAAELTTQAQADLPQAEDNAAFVSKTVNKALLSPGLGANFGMTGVIPNRPGSEASNTAALLKQIQGQNFLNAYQTLRGGGQITEVEGAKAQDAALAMQTAQSEQAFRDAAKDYLDVVNKGLERAKKKASGSVFVNKNMTPQEQGAAINDLYGQPVILSSDGIAPPKLGEIRKGHAYIGGDPASPSSWKAK